MKIREKMDNMNKTPAESNPLWIGKEPGEGKGNGKQVLLKAL